MNNLGRTALAALSTFIAAQSLRTTWLDCVRGARSVWLPWKLVTLTVIVTLMMMMMMMMPMMIVFVPVVLMKTMIEVKA